MNTNDSSEGGDRKRRRSSLLSSTNPEIQMVEEQMKGGNDDDHSESPSNRQRVALQLHDDGRQQEKLNPTTDIDIRGMKLEAIFHPKFENENQNDQQIRKDMINKVSNGEGVLEVSLKHSGSLVLWSGGKRYYSKNSTDNVHTHVAEVLLRQHFARSWVEAEVEVDSEHKANKTEMVDKVDKTDMDMDMEMTMNVDGVAKDRGRQPQQLCSNKYEMKYMECSDYIQSQRLTLSFEVVTSVLGHHGDLPKRDFLILIAVADRKTGKFYSTTQIMQFAQKFRLPHNDAWIFSSMESATQLFNLYDSSRETGLADDVIDTLTQAADGGHVKSLYPHATFQGQILEGIVIRFVRISSNDDLRSISDLCLQSDRILKAVPPEKELFLPSQESSPQILTPSACGSISLLRRNLRELFDNSNGGDSFDSTVRDVVDGAKIKGDNIRNTTKFKRNQINIPNLAKRLLEDETKIDYETGQICTLIQTLEKLNLSVNYNVLLEENLSSDDTDDTAAATSIPNSRRYLCIIHIIHDACHQKYHITTRTSGAMALYRGFSIQLLTTDDMRRNSGISRENSIVSMSLNKKMDKVRLASNSYVGVLHNDTDDGKLMLKMKFLPYMVRTFICRNGLAIIKKKGSYAFDQYSHDQLKRWKMSEGAIRKWLGFFHAWGLYCESPSQKTSNGSILPVLSASNYLHHFYHFEALYSNGHFNTKEKSSSNFHGLVVVVGVCKEEMTEFGVGLSNVLGCSKTCTDISNLTGFDVARSIQSEGGGMVCSAAIAEGTKHLRLLVKEHKEHIHMIMIGCSEEDIKAAFVQSGNPNNKELKKIIGMAKGWRNSRVNHIEEIPHLIISDVCAKFDENETLLSLVKCLRELSESNAPDKRPGMLVFFPSIPGCGKSTICSGISKQSLDIDNHGEREVVVKEGDKTSGKFWPLVGQEKMRQPSSIFIADKNAPPAAWQSIDKICSSSRAVAVSVLPDSDALADTTVDGFQYPFSLHYLALCLSRVLKRKVNSHNGKLDAGTEDACMIVVMFYCLYRNVGATVLLERMSKLGRASNKVIRLPFFKKSDIRNLPEIPHDLKEALQNAIKLQTRKDLKLDSSEDNLHSMEQELRSTIASHETFLDNLPANEEHSKKAFSEQLISTISSLGATFQERVEKSDVAPKSTNISIVSLDFKRQEINSILETIIKCNPDLHDYFEERDFESNRHVEFNDDNKKIDRFIQKTHCTFAHAQRMTQRQMRATFDHVIGLSCETSINAIVYDEDIAALDVSIPAFIEGETNTWIPTSINEFTHITIWCKKGVKAFLANNLPKKVSNFAARRIELESPLRINGTFSYWS